MKVHRITREAEKFYEIMGPIFGSREIAKEIGIHVYDDPDKQWYVCVKGAKLVGCASRRGNVVSDCYVDPKARTNGVFTGILSQLIYESEGPLRAACTKASEPMFKAAGFKPTRKTQNFVFMELKRA